MMNLAIVGDVIMPIPMVAGNWKMHTTVGDGVALVKEMLDDLDLIQGVEIVLCPPFVSLSAIKALTDGSSVRVGAQNMHYEDKGAFTGEVSAAMLTGLCQYVILGHSERRRDFGESDELINRKAKNPKSVLFLLQRETTRDIRKVITLLFPCLIANQCT